MKVSIKFDAEKAELSVSPENKSEQALLGLVRNYGCNSFARFGSNDEMIFIFSPDIKNAQTPKLSDTNRVQPRPFIDPGQPQA